MIHLVNRVGERADEFQMQDVKSDDWSENVAPFWGEV